MKNRIDSSINLEEIRRIAITELGMTYEDRDRSWKSRMMEAIM